MYLIIHLFYICFNDVQHYLKMIKIDQNMLESWQIVCKKYNFIFRQDSIYPDRQTFSMFFLSPHLNSRIVP